MIILPIQFLARAASFFHTIAFPFAMMRSNRMARFHSAWEKIRICVSARAFISNSRIQMIPKRTRSVSILVEEGCNLRLIKRCLRGREELESLIASLFEAFHDPSIRPPIYEINTSSFVSLSSLQTPFLKCKSHRETCCKIVGGMFVARSILYILSEPILRYFPFPQMQITRPLVRARSSSYRDEYSRRALFNA